MLEYSVFINHIVDVVTSRYRLAIFHGGDLIHFYGSSGLLCGILIYNNCIHIHCSKRDDVVIELCDPDALDKIINCILEYLSNLVL